MFFIFLSKSNIIFITNYRGVGILIDNFLLTNYLCYPYNFRRIKYWSQTRVNIYLLMFIFQNLESNGLKRFYS